MHGVRHALPLVADAVATQPSREPAALSRSFALNALLFLAVMVVLKLGKPLLVPFVLALFFYFLLAPLIVLLSRYRIPRAFTAAMVITVVFGALGIAALQFAAPAVGLISFDTLTDAALVPGSLLLLVTVEGQLITPILVGQRLDLSPVVVFVAVIFWGYMWGLVGALVAVPLVVSTKIVFSHVPALRPLAALLGR